MTTTHTHRGIVWLDMESPSEEDITGIVKRYGLNPIVGEELRNSPSLAKVEFYPDYMVVIITVPVRIHSGEGYEIADREVDFVIGRNFLITARPDTVEQLEYFAKIFDANAVLDKGNKKIEHAGHIFYFMIMRLYGGMVDDLENIRDSLLSAENHIFLGDERKMVEVLSGLSRELIDFRQTVRVHHDIWEGMLEHADADTFLGKPFLPYVRDIKDEFERMHELIANSRELLADLRETNDSLLNTKQNEIIKTLTLVAFIFYPLTFIAAIFTVPSPYVPLLEHPGGWWTLLATMAALTVGIWFYFRKKGWM